MITRRNAPLIVSGTVQLLISAVGYGWNSTVRPGLLAEYERLGLDLPWLAQVALTTHLVLIVAAISLLFACVIVASKLPRGRKLRWLGASIVLSGFTFMAAAIGSIKPLI